MTDPRTCTRCDALTDDTVSVVVSHGRSPVDGDDFCRPCAEELGVECGDHRLPDCLLPLAHRGICEVVA